MRTQKNNRKAIELNRTFMQNKTKHAAPEAVTYVLSHVNATDKDQVIPTYVTLLRQGLNKPELDQLFIDFLPIPRESWSYNVHDRILTWNDALGGGQLFFVHAGYGGGIGAIKPGPFAISVYASVTANFTCAVATNVGASCITNGSQVTGFNWNSASQQWISAQWDQQRLLLSYTYTPGTSWQPGTVAFSFTDNLTQNIPWTPDSGFDASLNLGQLTNGQFGWVLDFQSSVLPPADGGASPDSVYPCWMQANEDMAAQNINGVLAIDHTDPLKATLVGMQGQQSNSNILGYYQIKGAAFPFGVFLGKMVIDGKPVSNTFVDGDTLYWTNLPTGLQKQSGLPAKGQATFHSSGTHSVNASDSLNITRLSTAGLQLLASSQTHPQLQAQSIKLNQSLQDQPLNIQGLLSMSPYNQSSGQWVDEVQYSVTNDMQIIMNSFIPEAMWNLLFPDVQQPTLSGELANVANSPVPNVPAPSAWYGTLATAVMTSGMAKGSDENCQNMNGRRAAQWLKTQVAASPVYHAHSQLLFQYEWQNKFPLIQQYLSDQQQNTGGTTYQNNISLIVQQQLADITNNVEPDPTDPNLVATLTGIVTDLKNYTNENNLYWALCYFIYNTAPSVLANIAIQMSMSSGSSDPTVLSRMFQQNASVLTALDSSGYFAKKYIKTINVFMATNILPGMFGFNGDAMDFDMMKAYLQQFVTNNIDSEDAQIKQAAQQIQSILQSQNANAMLQNVTDMLVSLSGAVDDALALPIIAEKFLKSFKAAYPAFSGAAKVFCSLFIGGVAVLNGFMLIEGFAGWKKLSDAEKAELIMDSSQLGLQIVAAVAKRGVRIYSIFDPVNGLSRWQRFAGVNKILATGESDLDTGLARISNSTARWLGSADTAAVKVFEGGDFEMVLLTETSEATEAAVADVSLVAKVMGKNLDEFIGTRITPIFILGSIAFSIYSIVEGENTLEEASDIINIVGGSLMLVSIGFSTAGFTTIASVAGGFAVVAALAGIGIMIYEMLQTPPDPVQEFVQQYVQPAHLYIGGTASSIDYVTAYSDPNQNNLMMLGFTLGSAGQILEANNDSSISLVSTSAGLPATVWQVTTDGLGISSIFTIIQPDTTQPPVVAYLSLMSDNSVSFQQSGAQTTPSVVTQKWLSAPQGNATLANNTKHLGSLPITLQPVSADANGNYEPSNAAGYLVQNNTGAAYAASGPGTTFTLTMSGIAPNYMSMTNITFDTGTTPDTTEAFGPRFGTPFISTPCTFALAPAAPAFLSFGTSTGILQPNGQAVPSVASTASETLTATNSLGSASAPFSIIVQESTTGSEALTATNSLSSAAARRPLVAQES